MTPLEEISYFIISPVAIWLLILVVEVRGPLGERQAEVPPALLRVRETHQGERGGKP